MLANTERACVENCEILKLVNLPCGQGGPNKNIGAPTEEASKGLATGGKAGIAVVVIILLIAALVGALFYYRRKYKMAKVSRLMLNQGYNFTTSDCEDIYPSQFWLVIVGIYAISFNIFNNYSVSARWI